MRRFSIILFALTSLAASAFAEGPAPRWGHLLVYDEARDEILLFGGASERRVYRGDTWTWNDGVWTRHDVDGPSPRGFTAAAFDSNTSRVVLHGGRGNDNVTNMDTWAWNGSEWLVVEEKSEWIADHHQIVWDPKRGKLFGFGGWTGEGVSGVTWVLGDGWERLDASGPPPRASFGMAWSGKREAIVVYGGLWQSGQYADTWEWNGRRWTAVTGPYDDSSLDHHSLVWDPARERLVLFGGKNYRKEMSGRTRALSGTDWSAVSDEGPRARHSTPLVWHAKLERVVMFGGKIYEGDEQLPLGDMWSWDGTRWTELDR